MPLKLIMRCQYGPTNTFYISTPIGEVEIESCPKGLHSINQVGDNDSNFKPNPSTQVEIVRQTYQDNGYTYKPIIESVEWLKLYFLNLKGLEVKSPTLCPSILQRENFTCKVWRTLQERVLFGQTISYGQLASLCGNIKASQAVGTAMRRNPFSLVVPCHRVIQASGKIGNYSGGKKNNIKLWLLRHEGALK
ncbi:hypothetical protein FSP39_021718 [Pinctada imbricata]|uniref:Methylated-DNA--protein-cysteine methyltransferase n=1 Tax=Pinctada imbricata TaxID=66713 RepID=A0AA88XU43_PINIB|nr:hypothetical protein FSP39_021718 [Pinctada imbricata]